MRNGEFAILSLQQSTLQFTHKYTRYFLLSSTSCIPSFIHRKRRETDVRSYHMYINVYKFVCTHCSLLMHGINGKAEKTWWFNEKNTFKREKKALFSRKWNLLEKYMRSAVYKLQKKPKEKVAKAKCAHTLKVRKQRIYLLFYGNINFIKEKRIVYRWNERGREKRLHWANENEKEAVELARIQHKILVDGREHFIYTYFFYEICNALLF